MKTFKIFLENKILSEAGPPPTPPAGGAGTPPMGGDPMGGMPPMGAGTPPMGGDPLGGMPPMGGGMPPMGGGMPPMGGMGGAPTGGPTQAPQKLKATNVWDVLEGLLNDHPQKK